MSFPDWKEVERALKMKSSSNFSYSCFQMFFPSIMCLQLTPNTASPTSAALQCSLFVSLLAHPLSLGRAPHLPIPNQGDSYLLCLPILALQSLSPPWQYPSHASLSYQVWSIIASFVSLSSALSVHPQVKVLLGSFASTSAKTLFPHLAGWIPPLPNTP